MKRNIIKIDEEKCNGCGLCATGCPEGAIQMVNGKAHLVSENYCDGLGACIGGCPEGAITIEERDAAPYSEILVMENMILQGIDVVKAHVAHLLEHNEMDLYGEALEILNAKGIDVGASDPLHAHVLSFPGSANRLPHKEPAPVKSGVNRPGFSRLNQWPVKLKLISSDSPMFSGGVDLLVSADCVPYANGNFHEEFLDGKIMITFCPKLDPYIDEYREKLAAILTNFDIKSVTMARMEVPCCGGVTSLVREAIQRSGRNIPVKETIVKIV